MNYPSTTTHYTTLDISQNATQEEIKTAFRKLAIAHHSDKHATQKTKNHHTEIFKTIREASEWLTNPKLKERYNRELNARGKFDSLPFGQADPTRGERTTTAWDGGDGRWDSF
ncbi:J domain-containing protein [Venturia nashicola]|nr:J domain-containing protein [Venturia nashicola]